MPDPDWRDRARCAEVDTEIFFVPRGGSNADAKLVCRGCEVKAECLAFALENDQRWGVLRRPVRAGKASAQAAGSLRHAAGK